MNIFKKMNDINIHKGKVLSLLIINLVLISTLSFSSGTEGYDNAVKFILALLNFIVFIDIVGYMKQREKNYE